MPPLSICVLASGILAASLVSAKGQPDTLSRDVVIIGGGASGSYAAVRIRDDFGKTIALIEKEDILVSNPPNVGADKIAD
jgi:hypothetical protein